MTSIGFLAELITAYSAREEDSYSIAERVGHEQGSGVRGQGSGKTDHDSSLPDS